MRSLTLLIKTGLLTSLMMALAACNPSSQGPQTPTDTETPKPTARIEFPTLTALTESSSIRVRGTATGVVGSAVAMVEVNGIPAQLGTQGGDGLAHWSVDVPLLFGPNPLVVTVTDKAGNENKFAAKAQVDSQPTMLKSPQNVVLDLDANRALVVDSYLDAVVAVNLTDGKRTLLSGNGIGQGPDFSSPRDIALDPEDKTKAYVVDSSKDALMAVDLTTGDRTIVSDDDNGTGEAFGSPFALALDGANKRALVADSGTDALIAVDLKEGANFGHREVLSSDSRGTGPGFSGPSGIAIEGSQALVTDTGLDAVLAVDISADNGTGDRTLMAQDATVLTSPQGIALDSANSRALVVSDELIAVNLDNGELTLLSGATSGGGDYTFRNPTGVVVNSANNTALVVDAGLRALLEVKLAVGTELGQRRVISGALIGGGAYPLDSIDKVALDAAHHRVLAATSALDAVLAIDLTTGQRSVLAENTGGEKPAFQDPEAVALYGDQQLLVLDEDSAALLSVDLTTGQRKVLSGDGIGGSENAFDCPSELVLESDRVVSGDRLLVVDSCLDAMLAVNLETGERTVLSGADQAGDVHFDYGCAVLDTARQRALLVNFDDDVVQVVDLTEGDNLGRRTILSEAPGDSAPSLWSDTACGILVDAVNNRALVPSEVEAALVAVDLETGARSLFTDSLSGAGVNAFSNPFGITLDPSNHRALVIDYGLDALLAVDLETGTRVIVSK